MAKESRAFGSQRAKKAHLMQQTGGLAAEIVDLRNDVEEGFQNLEERLGFPELDFIDGGAPAAAGGDAVLVGRNLLQGQTFDTLVLTQSAIQMQLWAVKPGDSGITVAVVVGGALAIDYNPTTKVLTITLAPAGSTANAVATAINANAAETDGYIRASVLGAGTFTLAQASRPMAGGVGDYDGNIVMCAGKECLPANNGTTTSVAVWSDTQITVTVPALTPVVAADIAQLTLSTDGTRAQAISFAAA